MIFTGNPCFVAVVIWTDDKGEQTAWHYVFFDEAEANAVMAGIVESMGDQFNNGFVAGMVYPGNMFLPDKAMAN